MSTYAHFNYEGACVSVVESPAPLGEGWVEVPPGSRPELLYLSKSGDVGVLETVDFKLPRRSYESNGDDRPEAPEGLSLTFIGPEVSSTPASSVVMAAGPHYFEPIGIRFDTLEKFKTEAAYRVDADAGRERLEYVTDLPGQAEVYAAKLAEARAFGKAPQIYVFSASEAVSIIQRAAECDAALAEIEKRRMASKAAIANAGSVGELWRLGYVE